jgi:alpha-glucoside transport system substrate-binding protein
MKWAPTFAVLVVLALLILTGGDVNTANPPAGTVSVLASWTGEEQQAFEKVLPDVAVLPNAGDLATYMSSGQLDPLDSVLGHELDDYSPRWQRLLRLGGHHTFAVAVKADLKSIVWYDPRELRDPHPGTWPDLMSLSTQIAGTGETPWCEGVGAPPASGFPGTDWIEDILLHRYGTKTYQQWASGNLRWTSSQVTTAWQLWGSIVTHSNMVRGGRTAALLTDYSDAGRAMFSTPQGCALQHEGSFIASTYQSDRRTDKKHPSPGTDFNYFPFPAMRPGPVPSEVSADLAGMFNKTPQAQALMRFLASKRGQSIWPRLRRDATFSVNQKVGRAVYPDPVSERIAGTLSSDGPLCLDASDFMPASMNDAFTQAVMQYLAAPKQLGSLLGQLESVRKRIGRTDWLNQSACGR